MDTILLNTRATPFSNSDNCEYYAKFARTLGRREAEALYWVFFLLVIFLLFVTSWRYGKAQETVERFTAQSEQHHREMIKCLYVCCGLGLLALGLVIIEVFWLMTLQFCDGEPLIMLYWATWTMISVGSVIAILGIILAVTHSLRGRKHPPWALALGTPVLVIAGLGHLFHMGVRRRAKSIRSSRKGSQSRGQEPNESLSQAPTIQEQSEEPSFRSRPPVDTTEYNAKVLGYTPDGDLIIRFAPSIRLDTVDIPRLRQPSVSFLDTTPTLEKPSPSSLSERTMVREE